MSGIKGAVDTRESSHDDDLWPCDSTGQSAEAEQAWGSRRVSSNVEMPLIN